jgi:large subunit ribosomal protein L25
MATAAASLSASVPLPQRLLDFFARYPPKLYSAKYAQTSIPLIRPKRSSQRPLTTQETSSSDPHASRNESTSTPPSATPQYISQLTNGPNPNPFLPWRNPETSRWRAPKYSLRRQADLIKLAKKHGVEPLLPPSRKSTAFKEARLLEHGLRTRGTGEGQKVKGHKWERQMPAKLEKRRKAMEGMPALVRLWKQVSLMLLLLSKGVCMLIMPHRQAMDEDGRNGPDNDMSMGTNVSVYHPIITTISPYAPSVIPTASRSI